MLSKIKLGSQISVAAILKILSQAPPLALLQLCHKDKDFNLPEHLLQHAADLDFVQDVITAIGNSTQLNPVMNGILAGFNRRRRFNRFNYGNRTLEFDRLRFANTASELDGDQHAMEVGGKKKKKDSGKTKDSYYSGAICRFYQRKNGCYRKKCIYSHRCILCDKAGHGAIDCPSNRRESEESTSRDQTTRSRERPPNPRTRRARAN